MHSERQMWNTKHLRLEEEISELRARLDRAMEEAASLRTAIARGDSIGRLVETKQELTEAEPKTMPNEQENEKEGSGQQRHRKRRRVDSTPSSLKKHYDRDGEPRASSAAPASGANNSSSAASDRPARPKRATSQGASELMRSITATRKKKKTKRRGIKTGDHCHMSRSGSGDAVVVGVSERSVEPNHC